MGSEFQNSVQGANPRAVRRERVQEQCKGRESQSSARGRNPSAVHGEQIQE
ncbi:hypothetical protein chiPu_0031205, partial [Chiloscyllium punctatum]|nr:hypothetical protein [Chiloscyllium punctatum]